MSRRVFERVDMARNNGEQMKISENRPKTQKWVKTMGAELK
jgi:polysaccharide deacetylase 2 family uncharacterized protein YibQ